MVFPQEIWIKRGIAINNDPKVKDISYDFILENK
jgi:hypothetical protein